MIGRLIRAELTRLLHRRRVLGSMLFFIAFAVVTPITWMETARPYTAKEIADARQLLADVALDCPDCTAENFLRPLWSFNDAIESGVLPFAYLLCAIVLLTTVVYAASDFSSGVIATQLTFTPRRRALVFARAVISALFGAVMMFVGIGATSAVTSVWFVAMRGYAEFGDTSRLLDLFIWATIFGALLGFAGALMVVLFNGATGAAAAVLALLLAGILLEALGPGVIPVTLFHFSPVRQSTAFLEGRSELFGEDWTTPIMALGRGESLFYFAAVLVVLLAVTLLVFDRRDIKA